MKIVLIFIAFSFLNITYAQPTSQSLVDFTKVSDLVPPSPNSASLGQYGGINLGLASGTIQHSLPIYELVSSHLKLPITLNYSSNGLKVDAIASRVGLGWNLEAGGVITRTVMGTADEDGQLLSLPVQSSTNPRNVIEFMDFIIGNNHVDAQYDIFSFNFNGYNGKFILSNNQAILLSPSAIKIQTDFSPTAPWSFKIITPGGVEYEFGAKEESLKYNTGASCGRLYPDPFVTAWYLTKIRDPFLDEITFDYIMKGYHYSEGISETHYYCSNLYANTCTSYNSQGAYCMAIPNTQCLTSYHTLSPYLNEISAHINIVGTKQKVCVA